MLNAESLVVDARLLHKEKRYRAAKVIAILALEEVGRAQLAAEHMKLYKDLAYQDYTGKFLDHRSKIDAAQRALNPKEEPWKFRTRLYQDEKFNEQYVDYSWEFKSWSGPRSMDKTLEDTRYEELFRATSGAKASEKFSEMQEAGNEMNRFFVMQLIEEVEHGIDAVEHVLTEKDVAMVSVRRLILEGSLESPKSERSILARVRDTGVTLKVGELHESLEKFVRWKMIRKTGRVRVRYRATEFGRTGVWNEGPKIRIPPRRFTLAYLDGVEKLLEAKRKELDVLQSAQVRVLPNHRVPKIPPLSLQSAIDYYRKAIREQDATPEGRRVLTKWLVDTLKQDAFAKYYRAADLYDRMGDYLKAATTLNEYAVLFGIPFARRRRYPWFASKLMNNLRSRRRMPPFDAIQLWKDSYRETLRDLESVNPTIDDLRGYHMLQSNLSWLNFYSE